MKQMRLAAVALAYICGFVGVLSVPHASFADVSVSDVVRAVMYNGPVSVPAHRIWSLTSGQLATGDRISITAAVQNKVFNDFTIVVCPAADFPLYERGIAAAGCRGAVRQRGLIRFSYVAPQPGRYAIIFDNRFSMMLTKRLNATVAVVFRPTQKQRDALLSTLRKIQDRVKSTFVSPPWNLQVAPCGQENAFSTASRGDITLCSELVFDLLGRRMTGALTAVFMHELGHTLMNLWGLPGFQNEQQADEFALAYMLREGLQQQIDQWIAFFSEQDLRQGVLAAMAGDPHPLSVQRVTNLRRILQDPAPFVARWDRVLYLHMTTEALQKIAESGHGYDDPALAQRVLTGRLRTGVYAWH